MIIEGIRNRCCYIIFIAIQKNHSQLCLETTQNKFERKIAFILCIVLFCYILHYALYSMEKVLINISIMAFLYAGEQTTIS